MNFDPSTAKPVDFNPSTAKPVSDAPNIGDFVPAIGGAQGGLSLATGAAAAPIAGLSGIAAAIGKALGVTETDPSELIKLVQEKLTYQPPSKTGQSVVNVVSKPFEILASVGDKAGEKTADATGSPALGAAVNTAIQMAPMAIGPLAKAAKGKLDARLAASDAEAATKAAQRAVWNKGVQEAKDANYRLPPSQVNPSLANQALEGTGGGPKVAKRLSEHNQGITNNLARNDMGLPEDAPLTLDTLQAVRNKASQAYEDVKNTGLVNADRQYFSDLDAIQQRYQTAASGFPRLSRNEVKTLTDGLRENQFTPAEAIEQIKLLSEDANKAFKTGETGIGKANRQAMMALEDMLDRHLQTVGASPDLIQKYRDAKKMIAKTYSWQGALNPDGNINAVKIGKQLENGKPMDGDLLTVGKFGSQFPKAAQMSEKTGGNPFGMVDAGLGLAGAIHSPPMAVLAGARPALRALVTSKPYQDLMVNPPKPSSPVRRSLQTIGDFQENQLVPLSELALEQRQ